MYDCNFIKEALENEYYEDKNLTKMLSVKRATDYSNWFQVGSCLFNIDNRLLDDWIKFSKKCPSKFVEGECEKLWNKMKISDCGLENLHSFAKNDDPEKYNLFLKRSLQ